jgi:membrane glycosyltransferase
MQYWQLLRLPGLKFVSRYQLVFALLMFLGSPAWIALALIGTALVAGAGVPSAVIRPDAGLALFVIVLVMWFAPNFTTAFDVLTRAKLRRAFGGGWRFSLSLVVQTIFIILLLPIMWFSHSMFLARLLIGHTVGWRVQIRGDHLVPWSEAIRQFWPQTIFGLGIVAALAPTAPSAIPYALFIAGGPLVAVPFAVMTAWPQLGRALVRIGLGRLPEETAPLPELRAADVAAIELLHPPHAG